MKRKSIAYLIVLTLIASIALFSGCVEEETISPMETSATDASPTSTPEQEAVPTPNSTTEQETLLPTPTPEVKVELPVLEPGYEWYQDDEFGYRIAYPEDWEIPDMGLIKGQESAVMFMGEDFESDNPQNMGMPYILIIIYSDITQSRWWENPSTNGSRSFSISEGMKVGLSLENGTKMGIISDYGPVTINGRDGFELFFDPVMFMGFSNTPIATSRSIVFTVDDLDYTISAVAANNMNGAYDDTFEYVINSFVID